MPIQNFLQKIKFADTEADVKNIFQTHFDLPDVRLENSAIDLSAPHVYFEVKLRDADVYRNLAQLIFTIYRAANKPCDIAANPYATRGLELPEYIGAFDSRKCAIVEFDELYQRLVTYNDINWNQTPSAVDDKTVALVRRFVDELPADRGIRIYEYSRDEAELSSALKKITSGRAPDGTALMRRINFGNYVSVFMKFAAELADNIEIPPESERDGILLLDFYLADLLSQGNQSIDDLNKLKILRDGSIYKSNFKVGRRLFIETYRIKDLARHEHFWSRYKRPPKREYWDKIIERRDLLVPRQVRERKGAFFTPKIWVAKATEYMAEVFGDDFADMYVWDCAAGTGNLLQYLPQDKRNIFASTLDEPDVQIMKQTQITLQNNIFQFDFLNDRFEPERARPDVVGGGKMPDRLYDIIMDPEERKKLIIFINPPYAEARSGLHGNSKDGVAKNTYVAHRYKSLIGNAANEVFAQFLIRIYLEMRNCRLGEFSKWKTLQSGNFKDFRKVFKAKLERCFVVPADTFDNVKGKFPISFKIWNTEAEEHFRQIQADVYDRDGELSGTKTVFSLNGIESINKWISQYQSKNKSNAIGFLDCSTPDFQNQNYVFIDSLKNDKPDHRLHIYVDSDNLIQICVYFAVRHAIPDDWLNDCDQFLHPAVRTDFKVPPVLGVPSSRLDCMVSEPNLLNSRTDFFYNSDAGFKNNCLIFTLFHSQNRISSSDGTNHWVPFTESAVGSVKAFDSGFMSNLLMVRDLPDMLAPAGRAVFDAGLALWRYYFSKNPDNQNASFYDIKEFFKGRKPSGKMNNKSGDPEFNELESRLAVAMRALAREIEPKIYEYGFLRK